MRTSDRLGGATPSLPVVTGTEESRLRVARTAAHALVVGVPRWARIAAYAIPFTVLPSGLWWLPLALRDGAGIGERARPAVHGYSLAMSSVIVFETHSWSEDNDCGIATGWLPGRLSERGRKLAAELGRRRRGDGITAVFTSDLRRAVETAEIAFEGGSVPILHDWRLRECDYGSGNGMPAAELHEHRERYVDEPYPGGESWRQAIARVGRFLGDVPLRWEGQRIMVIGHVATRWALDHLIDGVPLEDLVAADFGWCEGWEYRL